MSPTATVAPITAAATSKGSSVTSAAGALTIWVRQVTEIGGEVVVRPRGIDWTLQKMIRNTHATTTQHAHMITTTRHITHTACVASRHHNDLVATRQQAVCQWPKA